MPIWLGFLWTLPNTLLGLVLGVFTFQMPRLDHGVVIFDRAPRGLTALLPRLGRTAMTIGFVIVSARPLEGRLLAHERQHVRQYLVWGPFLMAGAAFLLGIPVYLSMRTRMTSPGPVPPYK